MKKIKLGIVGLGNMGRNHLRIGSMLPLVESVSGFDPEPTAGKNACKKYNAEFHESLQAVIQASDALVICAPTVKHHEIAMACLNAGKHLLVEKPLAATAAQAEELVATSIKRGAVVHVGHVERFNPAYVELKNILQTEKPLALTGFRMSPYSKQAADVSVTFDLLIHDLDLVLDLMNIDDKHFDKIRCQAMGVAVDGDKLNYVDCQLQLPNGVLVHLASSKVTHEKIRQFLVTCHESFVFCDLLFKNVNISRHRKSDYVDQRSTVKYQQSSLVERVLIPNQEPLLTELSIFVQAVQDKTAGTSTAPIAAPVTAQDGLRALRLAEKIETLAMNV